MEELINNLILNYGLIAVFLLMFTNGFVSTPPSEITLSLAGIISFSFGLSLVGVIVMASLGNFFGAYIPFLLGRRIGYRWLGTFKEYLSKGPKIHRWIAGYIPNENVILAFSEIFKGKGAIWVGVFRCFPMVRSTITSLPAGIVQMNHLKFSVYSMIGIFVWAIFWSLLGYLIGEAWHEVKSTGTIVLIVVLLLIIYYLKVIAKKYIDRKLSEK